jgi:mono/diheme cytochrome c family protein
MAMAGCHSDETIADRSCPPGGTTLTYESFGKPFFDRWCVQCHGAGNAYSSRSFTTVDTIRAQRDRIFVNAAGDNTTMPPGPDDPPLDEREKLAEWLACGAK